MNNERKENIKKFFEEECIHFPAEQYDINYTLDRLACESLTEIGFQQLADGNGYAFTAPVVPEANGYAGTFIFDYSDNEHFETFDDFIEALETWEKTAEEERTKMFNALGKYLTK